MRFLAAQVDALLEGGRWLATAAHANAMASRLAVAVADVAGIRLAYPVQSNGVFTEVSRALADRLLRDWGVQQWSETADGKRCVLRWMTAFDTTAEEVARAAAAISRAAVDAEADAEG